MRVLYPFGAEKKSKRLFKYDMSLSGGCAESVMMPGMVIEMEEARLQTITQVMAFLDRATEIAFWVAKTERYQFIERCPVRLSGGAFCEIRERISNETRLIAVA